MKIQQREREQKNSPEALETSFDWPPLRSAEPGAKSSRRWRRIQHGHAHSQLGKSMCSAEPRPSPAHHHRCPPTPILILPLTNHPPILKRACNQSHNISSATFLKFSQHHAILVDASDWKHVSLKVMISSIMATRQKRREETHSSRGVTFLEEKSVYASVIRISTTLHWRSTLKIQERGLREVGDEHIFYQNLFSRI
ncbi:hypothetical protein KC19_N024000 [Ceratodon purpureus]|nr:hypothetical protein KC19_N024000 [Ceratodon purpureus]